MSLHASRDVSSQNNDPWVDIGQLLSEGWPTFQIAVGKPHGQGIVLPFDETRFEQAFADRCNPLFRKIGVLLKWHQEPDDWQAGVGLGLPGRWKTQRGRANQSDEFTSSHMRPPLDPPTVSEPMRRLEAVSTPRMQYLLAPPKCAKGHQRTCHRSNSISVLPPRPDIRQTDLSYSPFDRPAEQLSFQDVDPSTALTGEFR